MRQLEIHFQDRRPGPLRVLPHYSLFCGQLQTPSQSLLGKYVVCVIPNLVTFYFSELTHFLEELFFCSTNILVRLLIVNMKNCLTQKYPKMRAPILVTLLKMRPHPAAHPHQPPIRKYPPPPPSRGIGATENASKSPHLCVTVNKSSIRYGFHAGANPVRYSQGLPKPTSNCSGHAGRNLVRTFKPLT